MWWSRGIKNGHTKYKLCYAWVMPFFFSICLLKLQIRRIKWIKYNWTPFWFNMRSLKVSQKMYESKWQNEGHIQILLECWYCANQLSHHSWFTPINNFFLFWLGIYSSLWSLLPLLQSMALAYCQNQYSSLAATNLTFMHVLFMTNVTVNSKVPK